MPKCILTEQGGKGGGGGSGIVLRKIEVTTPPTKTSYLAGDQFDPTGMVVTASYGVGNAILTTAEATGYIINPTTLIDGVTEITITYSELGETCTTTVPVTVTHKLTGISVTTNPTKVSYEYGDTLDTSGMVVTATYSDGATSSVNDYTCAPTNLTVVGPSREITVSYVENGVTQTTTFNVAVERKSVAKPTWKANLTYNGNAQSVTGTDKWNNYNTDYMTIGGTTSATNAGTNQATFTLGDNYRWTDGTTDILNVAWVINKAAGSFGLSATTANINASNYSSGVVINATNPTGTISAVSSNPTACPVTVNGNAITIKGNGSTAGTFTITVSCAESTNYTAPANKTITVTIAYWSFGAGNGETADAAWFAGLKNYLASNTGASLGSILGKEKTVTLSSAVLGTKTHKIRVIGVDQDAPNTVTWQTTTCMKDYTTYGSSAVWIGSTVRTKCQEYYNAFPGKSAIKTVKKGTCPSTDNNRNGSVTYNDETVFLLSEREFGLDSYAPLSTANSSTSKAECTQGKNFAYSYYTDNNKRIFYKDNGSGTPSTDYGYPWERSRYYNSNYSSLACGVGSSGTANSGGYSGSSGLAPAFVIGN